MFLDKLFAPRPQVAAARRLFEGAIQQARDPDLYAVAGAPDTNEGRFELYTLHVVLLLRRLSGSEEPVVETRQGVFDAFVRNLDDGLREMGVGDLSVGKKMRRLAEQVYGRLKSYDEAFAASPPGPALEALIKRTVFAKTPDADPAPLAGYVARAEAALAGAPTSRFLEGEGAWPSFRS